MTNIADIEAANAQYAASFIKGHLPIPPKRYAPSLPISYQTDKRSKLAVVTCMDARIGTPCPPLYHVYFR
jgi:carbonic anhydrase